jgi:holliday junction DNA helicase RuvA
MISFLKGMVESKESGSIVINVNGVGYLVYVPSTDKFILSQDKQIIFTYLYIREDRIVLYGFVTKDERDFFKILIDTPGIGPKVALNIINDMGPEQFQNAVLEEDLNLISSVSGIGNKMAKKIILELKEKLREFRIANGWKGEEQEKKDFVYEGVEALKSLGYSDKEAKQRIAIAIKKLKTQKHLAIEDLIRYALNKTKL